MRYKKKLKCFYILKVLGIKEELFSCITNEDFTIAFQKPKIMRNLPLYN